MGGDYGVNWGSLPTSHGVGVDAGLIRALLRPPRHMDRSSLRRSLPRAGDGPRSGSARPGTGAWPYRTGQGPRHHQRGSRRPGSYSTGSGKSGPEPHPLPPAAGQLQHRIREIRRAIRDCGHAEGWFVAI